ncbi:MAG: metallopeptidase TldD-related protein [Bryobacterales bacterium]|nr:metallopeptidase TldD-related protein [Bryobacterales bacterium]
MRRSLCPSGRPWWTMPQVLALAVLLAVMPLPRLQAQVALPPAAKGDDTLRAMVDELNRSRDLRMMSGTPLYYLNYSFARGDGFLVSYSLGALVRRVENPLRLPQVKSRVGDYASDDGNFLLSGIYQGTRFNAQSFPLEPDYPLMRRNWWLLTDMAYKGSVQAFNYKKASMQNLREVQEFPDYSPAPANVMLPPGEAANFEKSRWDRVTRSLSEVFLRYPAILDSQVQFGYSRGVEYQVNTEGSVVRRPFAIGFLRILAKGKTDRGGEVWDGAEYLGFKEADFPSDAALLDAATKLADGIVARQAAPRGEGYAGPILFEGMAAPQLAAQLIGRQLWIPRKPVTVPNRPLNWPRLELEGRIGTRIVSENLTVRDDPTATTFQGKPLIGEVLVDLETVKPEPLTVIRDGRLEAMFRTRTPSVPGEASNGRARLYGLFGAARGAASNLFVEARDTVPEAQLRAKLLELVKAQNKLYGIVIRKLDFPSSADQNALRAIFSGNATNTGKVPVSLPLVALRLYPDGREELIRDINFRELEIRALRDVVAGDTPHVFHFLENGQPFAPIGAGTYVAETSVICPSLLLEEAELEPIRIDTRIDPVVAPPPLPANP